MDIHFNNNTQLPNLPKVLILASTPFNPLFETNLSPYFHFIKAYDSPLPLPAFLAAANSDGVTAALAVGILPITAVDVLDHISSLRCIVATSAGLDHIDLVECRRRGIVVSSAGDCFSDDCADYAVGILLDVLRKM